MSRFSIDWSELSLQVMITFGHFLWQACVIGFVLFVVQHVGESLRDSRFLLRLRRSSVSLGETDLRGANIRYMIACVAFFSLPLCVIATFAWVHQSRGSIVLVASDPVESPSAPVLSTNEATPTMANSDIPVLSPSATPINAEGPVTKPIEPPTLMEEPQTSPVQSIQAFAPYLLLAYIVGVGFMLARFSMSIIGSSRLRRTIQPITDVRLLRTIAEQCARVGLKRIPIVAFCQRVSVPVVVGIVKPMILLPPALLCGLDPNQIAAILSHELAHIRRYDLIVNFLQRIVEALLFFHPVTWWISRGVSFERENCCDDVAAACMGRLPYAGALLQMAELCIGNDQRRSAALATLSASGSNSTDLGYRIRRLIGAEETTRVGFTLRSFAVGLALIALMTVSLVAWGQIPKSEDEKGGDGAARNTPESFTQTSENQVELTQKAIARVVDKNTGVLQGRLTVDNAVPKLPTRLVPSPSAPRIPKRAPVTAEEKKKYEALRAEIQASLIEIEDESLQVDAEKGLANAFVYLAKAPAEWQPTKADLKPVALTMQDYRFEPRATIIRVGQDMRLINSGTSDDNFHVEPPNHGAHNRLVKQGTEFTLERPFISSEKMPVQAKSDMYTWKRTFLLPLDHPFAAVTDKQGRFSIEGLPPGTHTFQVWHERTGWLEKSLVVNIQAGLTTEVDRSYSVDRFRFVANKNQTDVTQQSNAEKPDSSKQSFQMIDGETGKPLQGLKCRAIVAKRNAPPRYQSCTTDEHGVVEMDVAKDESAGIAEVPSGWFSNGVEKKNQGPTVLKLLRGTEVDGRLLWPDKTSAAGVRLTAGVYINHQAWKEKLGMDLTHYSFDHGDWPNWSRTIVTDDDGNFRVTVPPKDARFWLRIGTTQLGFGPQINVGEDDAVTQRLAKCVPLEIQYGASSRGNIIHIVPFDPSSDDKVLHVGELALETGVIVRGRVVDAEGKGLSNVHLTSTGPHGPHSGRSATSGEDGKFEFPAMAAGNLTVHPDARLRDVTKPIHEQVISRDVQAVFVDQSFTIIRSWVLPHEIVVRAVPHTEVAFEWVDRRADKSQPIAFYGAFRVRGYMPDENGKPATYWTSETERVERDGKQWLMVKIPTQLLKPELMLVADSKVTASYSDSTGVTSGPGIVELGDITANTTRTIFGDEPLQSESPQAKKKEQSPSKSESAVRKRIHDLGGTMEVRERNGDAEEVRLKLMSEDKLASDEDLKLFATLKNLTRLEFRADHITSQGLDQISQMSSLKNLELWDCGLSDNDVGKLTNLKQLELLGFYNCRNVTDRSSQHLLQLPELHSLNLYGTPITVSFLQAIQGPRIRFLDLRRTGINAKDLSVIEKFPNLLQINLPDEVTDADLSHLSGLSELKILTLQDLNISDKGLLHLKSLTKVETLYLRNTQITDAGLSNILDMQNLETLDLSGTQISSAGLLPLATLPKLQTLDLQRTQVDDVGLKILSQFPRLQFLDLQDTNTTEAAVTALRNARPKMEIQLSN